MTDPFPPNDKIIDLNAARARRTPPNKPFINLPPMTLTLLAIIIAVQIVMNFISPETRFDIMTRWGFVPARFTQGAWTAQAIATLLSYMALHGGWTHLAVNGLTLAAFGAGVERWLGRGRYLILFFACGIAAAFVQLAVTPASADPVIGASGALSGLFAAIIIMMHDARARAGEATRTLPVIILWLVMTVASGSMSGLMGMPSGTVVAWPAHLGGFAAGFVVLWMMRRFPLSPSGRANLPRHPRQ